MNRLRGVALITAMLITALAGSLAATLAWDNALDVRRTMVSLYRDQAIQVAIGSEGWVRSILREDAVQSQNDHLEEIWATDIPALPIDSEAVQGQIFGKIEDLQGRFNVNNLVDSSGEPDPVVLAQFERLLLVLELDPIIAQTTMDWLDPNQDETIPGGAEDPMYSALSPPYRTADQAISNVTELAAINGMDSVSFEILLPHVIALPRGTSINVNTATVPVLQSLGESIDFSVAEGLLEQRVGGFVDYSTVFDTLVDQDMIPWLAESSQYFQLLAVVQIDTVRVSLFTVLYRDPNRGDVAPIFRKLGTI